MGRSISGKDHVTIIACDGKRSSVCPAQRALSISEHSSEEERREVCRRCLKTTRISKEFEYIYLHDLDSEPAPLPSSIESLTSYQLDGLPIGKTSLYDYLLATKRAPNQLRSEDLEAVRACVSDSVDVYLRLQGLFSDTKFDLLIVNNELYGMNSAACGAAQFAGIPVLNVNLGVMRSRLDRSIFATRTSEDYFFATSNLRVPQTFEPVDPLRFARELESEFHHRFFRRHSLTYSSRARRRPTRTRISSQEKRFNSSLLLSRPDELQTYCFVKDVANIDADQSQLLAEFLRVATSRPNLNFYIRLHPRMGKNQREGTQAIARICLEQQLTNVPPNVEVDLPETARPILSVLQESESVITSWSSVGLDAATIGVPVIFGIPGLPTSYPQSIGYSAKETSHVELARLIDTAIRDDSSAKQLEAIRFWANIWSQHLQARALPINLSPALLLLALSKRSNLTISPSIHSAWRRLELSTTQGFGKLSIYSSRGLTENDLTFGIQAHDHSAAADIDIFDAKNHRILASLVRSLSRFME